MATVLTVPLIGYETNVKDIIILFACLSGLHFNLENIIVGFLSTKDSEYALGCMLPYA